jgi:elongation factor P
MINTGELKRGIAIELDGDLYSILEYHHIKMGRGSAQVRLRVKNLRTGSITEKTVQAGERFQRARLDHHTVQFLYREGDEYHFMDTETFDQTVLRGDILGDGVNFLKENMTVDLQTYGDEPISVDLPPNVELRVTYTEPGFRGDTATGGNKPATVETGATVNVPLFVNIDDMIRVDTRTGAYIERMK